MVINKQVIERAHRIERIIVLIRSNKDIDMKEFVCQITNDFQCSERKAKEYIRIAEWRIKNG